ncbi:MAG: hypothetical protein P1V81_04110 [Planctomycetota bacterium]|nr:hypothetical protein [Planctomycetota bacterium]
MSKKEIQVTCPCCDVELLVDVHTQQVLRQRQPGEHGDEQAGWQSASSRVEGRGDRATDAFDAALGSEVRRERDLDDLFADAKKKVRKRQERDL